MEGQFLDYQKFLLNEKMRNCSDLI